MKNKSIFALLLILCLLAACTDKTSEPTATAAVEAPPSAEEHTKVVEPVLETPQVLPTDTPASTPTIPPTSSATPEIDTDGMEIIQVFLEEFEDDTELTVYEESDGESQPLTIFVDEASFRDYGIDSPISVEREFTDTDLITLYIGNVLRNFADADPENQLETRSLADFLTSIKEAEAPVVRIVARSIQTGIVDVYEIPLNREVSYIEEEGGVGIISDIGVHLAFHIVAPNSPTDFYPYRAGLDDRPFRLNFLLDETTNTLIVPLVLYEGFEGTNRFNFNINFFFILANASELTPTYHFAVQNASTEDRPFNHIGELMNEGHRGFQPSEWYPDPELELLSNVDVFSESIDANYDEGGNFLNFNFIPLMIVVDEE